ncbi:MAG TPA: hypothetical protein VJ881_10595 [Halanaerobiales bacterium]|nr:hypothetical protein [Halanaerobiales bacterium]
MEEGIILLLILFLIFNVGIGEISFPNISKENIEIEEEKITGNEEINETGDENNNIYKVFKESIQGNAKINLNTKNGDIYSYFESSIDGNANINMKSINGNIYIRFQEKITGNANINVKSNTGDIHILFEERLLGNPNISLQTNTGNIVFYNDRNTIRKFNINVNAVKIKYNKKDSANIFD